MSYKVVVIRIPKLIAGMLLLGGIAVNFANVVGRYFFASPIFWAEEAMIYISIWSVFTAMIAVTASNAHLRMDLISVLLPTKVRNGIDLIIIAAGAATMGYLCIQSGQSIMRLWEFGMRTISLQIPMAVPHTSILVGFSLSAVVIVLSHFRRS